MILCVYVGIHVYVCVYVSCFLIGIIALNGIYVQWVHNAISFKGFDSCKNMLLQDGWKNCKTISDWNISQNIIVRGPQIYLIDTLIFYLQA